jgi:RIO-like serine/threonine protein kinase
MSYHLRVLQSLVKLSRSSSAPSRSVLLGRAGGTSSSLGDALDTLVSLGLIQRADSDDQPIRLTLEGLAVGTAYAAEAARRADALKAEESVRGPRAALRVERRARSRTERRSVPRPAAANRAA